MLGEAFPRGKVPGLGHKTLTSAPAANGLATVLDYQFVGSTRYFDAGFPGRTVGLSAPPPRRSTGIAAAH